MRSRLLRVLETDQQAHSVNLETLIDTLYKINDVLLQRLQVLDSAIHENTLALAQFEEIARSSVAKDSAIPGLLQIIQSYISLLEAGQ